MDIEHRLGARSQAWKKFILHETFEYFLNFTFLAVFLVAFTWYRRLILANYHIQYDNYWMPLIYAAILAKVIMLGDAIHLGEKFRGKPLAVITLYQTVVFSLLVIPFSLVEHVVEAKIHGKTALDGIAEIAALGLDDILAWCVVILAVFAPFFAMKQVEKAFGVERVRRMFFLQGGTEHLESGGSPADINHSSSEPHQPAS